MNEDRGSQEAAPAKQDADPPTTQSLPQPRQEIPDSGIVEIFNYGRGRQGLIPLWVGEGDLPTPDFISDAASRSLQAGETFYTGQRGLPELRASIADYMTEHYGTPFAHEATPFSPERFFVTVGGMQALQIAFNLVTGPGDEILIPTPAWPNFRGVVMASGARPIDVPMVFSGKGTQGHWGLDVERLAQAITPRTRAIVINSPANPTGWTATIEDLRDLLALSRRHGLWIIADEIYGRLVYGAERAPSFHDVMDPHDQVLFAQPCLMLGSPASSSACRLSAVAPAPVMPRGCESGSAGGGFLGGATSSPTTWSTAWPLPAPTWPDRANMSSSLRSMRETGATLSSSKRAWPSSKPSRVAGLTLSAGLSSAAKCSPRGFSSGFAAFDLPVGFGVLGGGGLWAGPAAARALGCPVFFGLGILAIWRFRQDQGRRAGRLCTSILPERVSRAYGWRPLKIARLLAFSWRLIERCSPRVIWPPLTAASARSSVRMA